jgi:hypothetical protein
VGELAWAQLLYERLEPLGPLVATAGAGAVRASVHHYLGLLAESLGRHDVADAHFAEAAAVHARMDAPAFLARTRLGWACALFARGARETASGPEPSSARRSLPPGTWAWAPWSAEPAPYSERRPDGGSPGLNPSSPPCRDVVVSFTEILAAGPVNEHVY